VASIGGPLGDIAQDAALYGRATALATGERAVTYSSLLLRSRACLSYSWRPVWAFVRDGSLRVYDNAQAAAPLQVLQVCECQCLVGEVDDCKAGLYCFRLRHATGEAVLCAFSSKESLLWLQTLQANGVKYEDPPTAIGGVKTLYELEANLLSGALVPLSRYAGCVCLVVNVASF